MNKKELFVTPGLADLVENFKLLVEESLKDSEQFPKPIIILGPTGAGKTLFVKLFKKKVAKITKENIESITVNCASFEKGTARTELFGSKKGAYTDAI